MCWSSRLEARVAREGRAEFRGPRLRGAAAANVPKGRVRPSSRCARPAAGFQGEGIKTIVPRRAFAKLAARLVPDQTPAEVWVARVGGGGWGVSGPHCTGGSCTEGHAQKGLVQEGLHRKRGAAPFRMQATGARCNPPACCSNLCRRHAQASCHLVHRCRMPRWLAQAPPCGHPTPPTHPPSLAHPPTHRSRPSSKRTWRTTSPLPATPPSSCWASRPTHTPSPKSPCPTAWQPRWGREGCSRENDPHAACASVPAVPAACGVHASCSPCSPLCLTPTSSPPASLPPPQVLTHLMGNPPKFVRSGATIPALAAFQTHLNVSTTVFAFGLPDSNMHVSAGAWRVVDGIRASCSAAAAAAAAAAGAPLHAPGRGGEVAASCRCTPHTSMALVSIHCACLPPLLCPGPERESSSVNVPPCTASLGGAAVRAWGRGGGSGGGTACRRSAATQRAVKGNLGCGHRTRHVFRRPIFVRHDHSCKLCLCKSL